MNRQGHRNPWSPRALYLAMLAAVGLSRSMPENETPATAKAKRGRLHPKGYNKYRPHQGAQECLRRLRQMKRGLLDQSASTYRRPVMA